MTFDYYAAQIHSSKLLVWLASIGILIACCSMIILAVYQAWWYLLILPIVLSHAYRIVREQCLRHSPTAIVYCQQTSASHWRLRQRNGQTLAVKWISSAYRSPWLIILSFQTLSKGNSRQVLIPHDGMSAQNFTRLLSRTWQD